MGVDLSNEQLLDLWQITRAKVPWKGQLIAFQAKHEYLVVNQWFAEDRVEYQSGTQIEVPVMITNTGTARMILPAEVRTYAVGNVMDKIVVPWKIANAYYNVDDEEVARNLDEGGEIQLVDLVKVRRADCGMNMGDLLDELCFKTPASSTDVYNPFGLPYWVTPLTPAQITAGTEDGFLGQNPVYQDGNAAADCGGIDASLAKNSRFRNYVGLWSNNTFTMTDTDVQIVSKMVYQLKFKSPMTAKDVESGGFDKFRYFTCLDVILAMDLKARMNNDSLGADLGKFAGSVVIRGNPVYRADELDETAPLPGGGTLPFFAINMAFWKPFVQKGRFFREIGPMNDRAQPTTFTTNVDLVFNTICTNRQRQGVIVYDTA